MSHFGIISPPVSGHINPFAALGRELIERGHRVTIFHFLDLKNKVLAEGLEFVAIGQSDHPLGDFPISLSKLGKLHGASALKFTIQAVAKTTEMFLRDGPEVVKKAGIDMLLVDQMEPAGGAIADHLGLPFVTICNALALNEENTIPPAFSPWGYSTSPLAQARNILGYRVSQFMTSPIANTVRTYRTKWGLPIHKYPDETYSTLAQICQQAKVFDFPRKKLPACFHYVGPIRKAPAQAVDFPWNRLDGRPLIYSSLGTLQNGKDKIFKCFAEACVGLNVQLIISHAGGLDQNAINSFPGDPLVVHYSPQTEVLKRASLTLTHAGLNTVLDSLAAGVPLIALPIAYEQPAIATRVAWLGAGKILSLKNITPQKVQEAIVEVLNNPVYKDRAKQAQAAMSQDRGVSQAADIIEDVLKKQKVAVSSL